MQGDSSNGAALNFLEGEEGAGKKLEELHTSCKIYTVTVTRFTWLRSVETASIISRTVLVNKPYNIS